MQVLRDAIFISALVTAVAYARWHFWWRSGFGCSNMCLLLSLAALTMEPALRDWTRFRVHTIPGDTLTGITYVAVSGVLASVLYMLYLITQKNIHRIRNPACASRQGRLDIQRTPGATQPEVEKMLACWDESRGLTRPETTQPRPPTQSS